MKKISPVSRSGRFARGPGADVTQFTESVSFDWRLWRHDILGSLAHAAMLRAIAEREATQGFWRKWGAVNRATRACIALRSAQALVRIALRKAEDQKIIEMGVDPRDPRFGWMHRHSEAETYLL